MELTILKKLILDQLVKKVSTFMEAEGLLPSSQ
jgi:hypothetical protein